ncbi:MAG: outer membrane beta-barrel protein [Bacteroidales bacterium]|nr:outer membrane beta-barrel protein [Bacteroidales bacterium]
MKRIIKNAILVMLLAVTGSLSAQTMINGGYKVNLLNHEGDESLEIFGGYYVGLTQNVALSAHTGWAPGIYFTRFSGEYTNTKEGVESHHSQTETAIAVPAPLNAHLNFTEKSCLYLFAGPEFNIGIGSKGSTWLGEGSTKVSYDSYEEGSIYERNRFNISWIGGVGLKLDFATFSMGATGNFFNRMVSDNLAPEKAYSLFFGLGLAF